MKKILLLICFTVSQILTYSQNCNIGNEDTTGSFLWTQLTTGGDFGEDYLLGVKFNLNTNGTLHSLNLIGKNTGAQVQMAVYADSSGVPTDLIVSSGIGVVGLGTVTLPVSPISLVAGDYWVMAIYNDDGGHTYPVPGAAANNIVRYQSLIFGSPLPTNASNFSIDIHNQGNDYAYFLEISCVTAGEAEFLFNNGQKRILRTIDVLGRETKDKKNEPLFYIYDDGTVEKRIVIE